MAPPGTLVGMRTTRVTWMLGGGALVATLALGGCTGSPGSSAPTSSATPAPAPLGVASPAPPEHEVIGTGTVMEVAGEVQLCLGPIMESYPPQCNGIPLAGWSWDGLDGAESSGDTTWGSYAVTGTFDGTTFTLTGEPLLLALYDPMPWPDPTGGQTGSADEATLTTLQDELPARLGSDGSVYFGSTPDRGYLWVDVLWDDGTYQDAADAEFGEAVVIIRSALRVIEG